MSAVILAAGAATRMGRLKQLLPYGGGTLLGHAIAQAQEAGCSPVVVVAGAEAASVVAVAESAGAVPAVNEAWQSGMGSSVVAGVRRVLAIDSASAAVLMMLADQPRVRAQHLTEMMAEFDRTSARILAASYSGTLGVPAIFRAGVFDQLLALPMSAGAKALLKAGHIVRFELPEAAVDIDTPEDFALLLG